MIFNSLKEQHEYIVKQREEAEKAKAAAKPAPKKTTAKAEDE